MTSEPILTYVLRNLRETRLRQRDIADATGVPYSSLTKIAQGVIRNPGVQHIQALADFFAGQKCLPVRKKAA